MKWTKLVKIIVCVLLLQGVGYLILHRYNISWNIFTQLYVNYMESTGKTHTNEQIKFKSTQFPEPVSGAWKSIPTVGVVNKESTNPAKAPSVTDNNTDGSWESEKDLVQEVTALLKAQLELNTTMKPSPEVTPCNVQNLTKKTCVYPTCTQLSNNITERVQSLFSKKTVLTKAQDDLLRTIAEQIPENDVILLSAASSNHYDEMQAMMHSLHSKVIPGLSKTENVSLVFWDLGLTSEQRKKTEKCCRCQVISFPFEKFPNAIRNLNCYMWKPLAIRMTLTRARKYVVWQDASIRYNSFPGPLFEKVMQQGLQLWRVNGQVSTVYRTLPEAFAYLGQTVCSFYPHQEMGATFGVYKHDPFVLTAVTNLWARCGFEEKCMCPRPPRTHLNCETGPCHRYDQSALTIITAALYGSELYRIFHFSEYLDQYFTVQRGHTEHKYFQSMKCLG